MSNLQPHYNVQSLYMAQNVYGLRLLFHPSDSLLISANPSVCYNFHIGISDMLCCLIVSLFFSVYPKLIEMHTTAKECVTKAVWRCRNLFTLWHRGSI